MCNASNHSYDHLNETTVADAAGLAAIEAEITTLAASIAVATHRLLQLIAELDQRAPWAAWGLRSCAHWLNWKCGIALGAAREKVRVAHALAELPRIDAAFATGELSYSKVRAMTRVATPHNEDILLNVARHGTAAHVERLVAGYRRARRLESARGAYVARSLDWSYDEDGSIILRARLPADQGALVIRALQAAASELRSEREGRDRETNTRADVSAETHLPSEHRHTASYDPATDPPAAARADALCHLAEQFLANESAPARQADRYQVVVHMHQPAKGSAGAQVPDDEFPSVRANETGFAATQIDHGPQMADETVYRTACDASVLAVVEDAHGTPLDIGRRTRSIPPAIRRALERRDGGCRFPGCLNHRHVDAHHIRHWAEGGATRMDNLVLLCRHHHRLMHEFGFRIGRRDDGQMLFFRPDSELIPAVVPAPRHPPLIGGIVVGLGADVSAETSVPHWRGEPMDVGLAVAGMFQRAARAANSP